MNIRRKLLYSLFLILFSLTILAGCESTKKTEAPQNIAYSDFIPQEFLWEPVAPGIERFDFENPAIPLVYHAVKIDLTNDNLQLVCYPDDATKQSAAGTFKGMTTTTFAKKNNCIAAINVSPFEGRFFKKKIIGMHFVNGNLFSKANSRYSSIVFFNDRHAQIIKNQEENLPDGASFAFGGFFTVLQNGQVQYSFAETYNSRSGAGISQDGKILYLLVVEGENSSKSTGLTYQQCGEIFLALGCTDALEFDGGGSAEICLNGKSLLNYKNRRIQANSFGFKEKE